MQSNNLSFMLAEDSGKLKTKACFCTFTFTGGNISVHVFKDETFWKKMSSSQIVAAHRS